MNKKALIPPPDADKVLAIIASSLTEVKNHAALSHYDSRNIWVARLNESLERSLSFLKKTETRLSKLLKADSNISKAARKSKSLKQFRKILPAMIRNHISLAARYVNGTRPEPIHELEDGTNPEKTFDDFSQLATLSRQYVDSTIQDAYQLALLDAREFNFHVLNSLDSFVQFATPSLQQRFMSKELVQIIEWFDQLPWKQRKNSATTRCQRERFGEKVNYLVGELHPEFDLGVDRLAKATFRFCSEATHVGYVSTIVTSGEAGGLIMGSKDGFFLASTENYVELEYMLLKGASIIFADLYLRAIMRGLSGLLNDKVLMKVNKSITAEIARSRKAIKLTGLELTQFVARQYNGRPEKLKSMCICGEMREWSAPFDFWSNYCAHCGTKYNIVEWPEDVGYVITIQGPCDVIGSIHPQIDDLPAKDRQKLYSLWEAFKTNRRAVQLDSRYLWPALTVRNLSTFVIPSYAALNQELGTFVSGKKLADNDGVPIFCNCGCVAILKRGYEKERWRCFGCGAKIKMLTLEGDPGYVVGLNPDGTPRLIPVQGSDERLSPDEQKRRLESIADELPETKRKHK